MRQINTVKIVLSSFVLLAIVAGLVTAMPARASAPMATANDLIDAFVDAGSVGAVVDAEYIHTAPTLDSIESDPQTTAVFSSPKTFFPTSGSSYIGLSNGLAGDIIDPNGQIDTGLDDPDNDPDYNGVFDATVLRIGLNIPSGANCLQFDAQLFSAEFPEYIGTEYNDAFIAEIDANDWSVSNGTDISAPHNFALAPGNKVFSINAGLAWSNKLAKGTSFGTPEDVDGNLVYHGGTAKYIVSTPITPGAHDLYLSVWDMSDSYLDTAVFLDRLRIFTKTSCPTGLVIEPPTLISVAPASGPIAGKTTLTITGTNFLEKNKVTIGGVLVNCTVVSDQELSCVSPAHAAGSVDIVLTNLGGTATLARAYTYVDPNASVKPKDIPDTGFAPSRVTRLPAQPASAAYSALSSTWLEIPSQEVSIDIVGVPFEKGNWDVTWLGNNAGWLNGTAYPTWKGNSVITAHVTDANGKPGPFAGLKNLAYGSKIVVHLAGQKYTYEVRSSSLLLPGNVDYAFQHLDDHAYLTLITCQGYNFLADSYMFRRVVRAVLVSVSAQ